MRVVSIENGSGGSSPGCISSAAQSIVRPSSRGGVPVFKRPSAKPARSSVSERPIARRLADAAGRNFLFADMDEAAQKRAGGQNHRAGWIFAAIGEVDAANTTIFDGQIVGLGLDHVRLGVCRIASCIAAA